MAYKLSGTSPFKSDSKTGGDGRKRHFLWAASITIVFGEDVARKAASIHESGEDPNNKDPQTDVKANEAAIKWAKKHMNLESLFWKDENAFWAAIEKGYECYKKCQNVHL